MFLTKCIFVRANRFFLKKLKFEKSVFYPTTGYDKENARGGLENSARGVYAVRPPTWAPMTVRQIMYTLYTCINCPAHSPLQSYTLVTRLVCCLPWFRVIQPFWKCASQARITTIYSSLICLWKLEGCYENAGTCTLRHVWEGWTVRGIIKNWSPHCHFTSIAQLFAFCVFSTMFCL